MDAVRSAAHALRARLIGRLKAKRDVAAISVETPHGGSAASRCRGNNASATTRDFCDWGVYEEISDGGATLSCTYEDFANCNLPASPGFCDRSSEVEVYGYSGDDGRGVHVSQNHSSPPTAQQIGGGCNNGGETTLETLVALHAFAALEPGMLSFKQGDLLDVLVERGSSAGGWWLASDTRGQIGLVPSNYLACVSGASTAATVSDIAQEVASTASTAPIASPASSAPTMPSPDSDRPQPAPRRLSRSPQPLAQHERRRKAGANEEEEGKRENEEQGERRHAQHFGEQMQKVLSPAPLEELQLQQPEWRVELVTPLPEQPERVPAAVRRRPSRCPAVEHQRRSAPSMSHGRALPPSPPRPRPRASTAADAEDGGVDQNARCGESDYAMMDASALPYFHLGVERDECKQLLEHDGDYLLRDSRNGRLTLSVKGHDRVHHFLVSSTADGRVAIGRFAFPHIVALTEHYRTHPIYKSADERLVLGRPVASAHANNSTSCA